MAHKLLVALDASEGAWRAVEYVADTFGQVPGAQVTLMHILTGLPPAFWDDGHILDPEERKRRQKLVTAWQEEQEKAWRALVRKAGERLAKGGFSGKAVASKFKPRYYDVAEDLISEAETGGFGTIVMGRRGLGKAKSLLLGSVATKVVQSARACAVTVVQ
jgi:nucleotide-binding universal stress UspA family protein